MNILKSLRERFIRSYFFGVVYVAMMRICRCGRLIDYNQKYCDVCGAKKKVEKTKDNRLYDQTIRQGRDKVYDDFYSSKEWIKTTDLVKNKYNYVDIYSYYVLNKTENGYICHHLRPIKTKDGWDQRLNVNGIIYLTKDNHDAIHALMRKDSEGTIKMLEGLIARWEAEMMG